MWLYRFMSRLPVTTGYARKMFAVCFVGTHLPLVAFIVYLLGAAPQREGMLVPVIVMLAATLAGTAVAFAGLRHLLQPIVLSRMALEMFAREGAGTRLPAEFRDEAGQLMREVDEAIRMREAREEVLRREAETDSLTGLRNRRAFEVRLERAVADARERGASLSVIVFDIDHFKAINDTYGHPVGDEVLRLLAEVVRAQLRPSDMLSRIGGEEFAIVVAAGLGVASEIAERLRGAVADKVRGLEGGEHVTASFGVATLEADDDGVAPLVRRADAALYEAKRSGRNRVVGR